MKLFEISDQYQQVLEEAINVETGEINESALMRLDDIKESAEQKGIAVASCIKNLMAEHEAVKAARNAMVEREKRLEREVDWLKEYLRSNMERCEINEISCPYFVIKMRKNPASVDVKDESLVPREYIKEKTVTSIDKLKIHKDIVAGSQIPGVELINRNSIVIR
jgi:hypothetical protein